MCHYAIDPLATVVLGGRLLDRALAVLAQNGGPSAGESLGAQLYLNKANALGRRGQHPEALVRRASVTGTWAAFFKESRFAKIRLSKDPKR